MNWLQDIRFGLRMLRKTPEVTAVALVAMALAIGATTTVFSVVNGMLLRPLPFEEPDRLVAVFEIDPASPAIWRNASVGNFADWARLSESFESLVVGRNASFTLSSLEIPETPLMRQISPAYFETLGIQPILGRTFLPEEGRTGAARVMLLHHELWQKHFGGDPNIVGRTTELDGEPTEIVGVMPPGFDNPVFGLQTPPQAWVPLRLAETGLARTGGRHLVIGRLKDGVRLEQAQQEFDAISANLAKQFPDSNENIVALVTPLKERIVRGLRPALLLLLGAVLFVLLVACGNVANLLLARSMARRNEIALRRALGAGMKHLLRQLVVESLLLTLLGGALGLLLAVWGTQAVEFLVPQGFNIPPAALEIDHRVLLFTLAVSVFTGLLFGTLPAHHALGINLESSLGMGASRATGTGRSRRLRGALVTLEVALSLVLLISAGLMVRSFAGLQGLDPGFRADNTLTFRVSTRGPAYEQGATREAFFRRLVEEFESIPGVIEAGGVDGLPFFAGFRDVAITIASQPPPDPGTEPRILLRLVVPGFLDAMKIPLLKGRALDLHDTEDSANAVVISRTMAEEMWPEGDPIGEYISVFDDGVPRQVVGIVGDVRSDLSPPVPQPIVYTPLAQRPSATSFGFVVRTRDAPLAYLEDIRRKVAEVDSRMPVYLARPLEEAVAQLDWASRFIMSLLGIFAILALGIAATGIYAVLSYAVSQRSREIGIRIALGARRASVLNMVLKSGLALAAGGIAIGLLGAAGFSQVLASQLYGIAPTDPATYLGFSLILGMIALGASAVPALRATRVNPADSLRQE